MIEAAIRAHIREVKNFPRKGIRFKDITPVLQNAALCKKIVQAFSSEIKTLKIDAVAGIESRGFFFGMMLAQKLGVPFIPVRKTGKLPYKTISHSYDLEYGSASIEMHTDAIKPGNRVLIHDDLLATGGTAVATAELIGRLQGKVAGFSFLIELDAIGGRKMLAPYSTHIVSLVHY